MQSMQCKAGQSATNPTVPNNYSNPNNYSQTMFAFGARHRISGCMLSGTAGLDLQNVNQGPDTTMQFYEFSATSPVVSNDYYFKTRAGYRK